MSNKKYQISDDVIKALSIALKSIGLKQVKIAEKIGMSSTRISDVRAKRYRIPFQLLEGLHLIFGISIDSIISGEEKEKPHGGTAEGQGVGYEYTKEQKCMDMMREIFKSGDKGAIHAMESNLDFLKSRLVKKIKKTAQIK